MLITVCTNAACVYSVLCFANTCADSVAVRTGFGISSELIALHARMQRRRTVLGPTCRLVQAQQQQQSVLCGRVSERTPAAADRYSNSEATLTPNFAAKHVPPTVMSKKL